MTTVLQYVVLQACERCKHNGSEFTTANFQSELSRVTGSRPMVTPQVARLILLSIPGVVQSDMTGCHWRYQP
jgi:hypothetical protein